MPNPCTTGSMASLCVSNSNRFSSLSSNGVVVGVDVAEEEGVVVPVLVEVNVGVVVLVGVVVADEVPVVDVVGVVLMEVDGVVVWVKDVPVVLGVDVALVLAVVVPEVVGVVQLAHFSCFVGHTMRIGLLDGTQVPVFGF